MFILSLTASTLADFSKKSLPIPLSCRVMPMLSSNILMVSACRFRFLIHVNLTFVLGDRWSLISYFCRLLFSCQFLRAKLFPKLFSVLLSKMTLLFMGGIPSGVSVLFHRSSLSLYQTQSVLITTVYFEVWNGVIPPGLFLFFSIASPFVVSCFFRLMVFTIIYFPVFVKNVVGGLHGITLHLYMAFSNMEVLMMLILLLHQHGNFLHF